jgi:hypothetical protein
MRAVATIRRKEHDDLALALDIDVYQVGICHACLSFIALPLERGREDEVERALSEFAPILWDEGLALPIQAALQRAVVRGVQGAVEAARTSGRAARTRRSSPR